MSRGNIAFIPARSGSKRVPDKNIKILNRHPLIAYTIQTAISSEYLTKSYVRLIQRSMLL